MQSTVYDGDADTFAAKVPAPEPRRLTCPAKGRPTHAEGEMRLSVTATRRDQNAVMRRMVRASQILLAGYERLDTFAGGDHSNTNGGVA